MNTKNFKTNYTREKRFKNNYKRYPRYKRNYTKKKYYKHMYKYPRRKRLQVKYITYEDLLNLHLIDTCQYNSYIIKQIVKDYQRGDFDE